MTCGLGICAITAALLTAASGSSDKISGQVLWVVDGDTYRIAHDGAPGGEAVRARHFDTPEKGGLARCEAERVKAAEATAAARRLLPQGSVVGLSEIGRDRYGRLLATVTLPDGSDIARRMIAAGLARPYEGGRKQGWCGAP